MAEDGHQGSGTADRSANALQIHLEEYKALRAEIELNLKTESDSLNLTLVLVGALLVYVGSGNADSEIGRPLLSGAPLLFAFLYAVVARKLNNNRRISQYVKTWLQRRLTWLAGDDVLQWDDHKHDLDGRFRRQHETLGAVFEWFEARLGVWGFVYLVPLLVCVGVVGPAWPWANVAFVASLLVSLIALYQRCTLDRAFKRQDTTWGDYAFPPAVALVLAAAVLLAAHLGSPVVGEKGLSGLEGLDRAAVVRLLGTPDAAAASLRDLARKPYGEFEHPTRPIEDKVLLYLRGNELLHVYVNADGRVDAILPGVRK